MNYLQNKKNARNKFRNWAIFIVSFLIIFYFRIGIFKGLSYLVSVVFRPALTLENKVGGVGTLFKSKRSLEEENASLKLELESEKVMVLNYASLEAENLDLKQILGREDVKINTVLAAILSKPNQSPYDTLLVDVGTRDGISVGNKVFVSRNIPIGRVSLLYPSSAKVTLFSNAGEKTQVSLTGKNIFMEIVGRGGGNFEMTLPRDLVIEKGAEVTMPGINPHLVAIVEAIISDPRDAFQKALLVAPANIQELRFVEVEK